MLVNKAYNFPIYPNKHQQILIPKTIPSSPFLFNHFLPNSNHTYKQTPKPLTYNPCSSQLT
ncbi:helix-turn-helix domain-containing protein, partial [Bacillus mycoides]|uniref:helix-turn-helix domain-containing protein n=1 Tax=Bacillus mycoides TaxID=1405 RepID=UPI001F181B3B